MVITKILNTFVYKNKIYNKGDELKLSLIEIDKMGSQNFEIIKFINENKFLVAPPKNKMVIFPDMCKNICVK